MAPYTANHARTIYLEKTGASLVGSLAQGTIYSWTYKSLSAWEAQVRARKALKRDHPDENELAWKLVTP